MGNAFAFCGRKQGKKKMKTTKLRSYDGRPIMRLEKGAFSQGIKALGELFENVQGEKSSTFHHESS